jgi:peptidoglycan-associated lipoprotein
MHNKILGLIAAVALVAACETAPSGGASTGGAGGTSGAGGAKSAKTMAVKPGSQEDLVVNVGDRVFFNFDKFNISAEARKTLELQAAWMKKNASVTVTIQGHADERGTREYNLALGERRASSVKDYLITLGVNPQRIDTISYGKERPVAIGSTNAAWAQNRRGVTKVAGAGS